MIFENINEVTLLVVFDVPAASSFSVACRC